MKASLTSNEERSMNGEWHVAIKPTTMLRSPDAVGDRIDVSNDHGQEPLVSVMIVSWNSRHLLDDCLKSLADAAGGISYETLVIDNGSRDGTVEHLRKHWPDVTVIPLPRNQGFGVANNVGFARSKGKYILVLNPDTQPLPGMMHHLVNKLRSDPSIGCVGARHLNPDMSLQWSMDDFPWFPNEALHYTDLYRIEPFKSWVQRRFPRWSDHDVEVDVDWVNGACMMVPRKVYEATGGFDEYFFLFAEELDWCLRIWRAGFKVRFVPSALLVHRLGGTFSSSDPHRLAMIYQSGMRYYRRHNGLLQYLAIVGVVKVNALVRLGILGLLAGGERLNLGRISDGALEIITQHPRRLSYRDALRMWWNVLRVLTDSAIRPQDPPAERVSSVSDVAGPAYESSVSAGSKILAIKSSE